MTVPVQDHLLEAMANYAHYEATKMGSFYLSREGTPGLWAQETAANNNKKTPI